VITTQREIESRALPTKQPTLDVNNAPYEAKLVHHWLINGKPELGWRGDPRLFLGIGVVTASKHGTDPHTGNFYRKGDVVAHAYQVWRHNEDGTDKLVLQRRSDEWERIIPAMVGVDLNTPGRTDVMDDVIKENAAVEKANTDEWAGHYREQTEHLWRLVGERTYGRNTTYQVPGRNPDKQD
jgi:hypothetical protein